MIILAAFLAGVSCVIAVFAYEAVRIERERAQSCERALNAALSEHGKVVASLAHRNCELEAMIRAVAAASVAPTFPVDQSQVYISVPGPRTAQ